MYLFTPLAPELNFFMGKLKVNNFFFWEARVVWRAVILCSAETRAV